MEQEQVLEFGHLSGEEAYHQAVEDFYKGDEATAEKKFLVAASKNFRAADLWLYSFDVENAVKREKAKEAYQWLSDTERDQNQAWVQSDLGFCYQYGIGCNKDLAAAKNYYEVAAKTDYLPAIVNLSHYYRDYRDDPSKEDLEQVFNYTQRAAEMEHIESKYDLAVFYEMGAGCNQSIETAKRFYEEAARANYLPALAKLVFYYSQDDATKGAAFEFAKRGADLGDANMQYYVARCYEEGIIFDTRILNTNIPLPPSTFVVKQENFEKNLESALKYYRLAANQKHTETEYQLGKWYQEGRPGLVGVDQAIATEWFHLAAQSGHERAQEEAATRPVIDDVAYEDNFSLVIENLKESFDLKLDELREAEALEKAAQDVRKKAAERGSIQQIEDITGPAKQLDAEAKAERLRKEAEEPFIGVLAATEVCKSKIFKWRFYQRQNNQVQRNPNLTLHANLIAGLCHSQGISGCEKNNNRAIYYYREALRQEETNLSSSDLRDAVEFLDGGTSESVRVETETSRLDTHEAIANALLCDLWRDYSEVRKKDQAEIPSQKDVKTLNTKELALETFIPELSESLTDFLRVPTVENKNAVLAEIDQANRDPLLGAETTGLQIAVNVGMSVFIPLIGLLIVLIHRGLTGRWGLWSNDFGDMLERLEKNVELIVPKDRLLSEEKLVADTRGRPETRSESTTELTKSISEDDQQSYNTGKQLLSQERSRSTSPVRPVSNASTNPTNIPFPTDDPPLPVIVPDYDPPPPPTSTGGSSSNVPKNEPKVGHNPASPNLKG